MALANSEAALEECKTALANSEAARSEADALAASRGDEGDALRAQVEELASEKESLCATGADLEGKLSAAQKEGKSLAERLADAEEQIQQAQAAQVRWLATKDTLEQNIAAKSVKVTIRRSRVILLLICYILIVFQPRAAPDVNPGSSL